MPSDLFIKPGSAEQELRWAKIWMGKFNDFIKRYPSNGLSTKSDGGSGNGSRSNELNLRDSGSAEPAAEASLGSHQAGELSDKKIAGKELAGKQVCSDQPSEVKPREPWVEAVESDGLGLDPSVLGDFTAYNVVRFLRSKRDLGMPGWKRMKIIRALMVYRRLVMFLPDDDLIPLKQKMEEIILVERCKEAGYGSVEESVGKIDPSEIDAVQEFRRALRKDGKRLQTERSYVGKLKAFMAARGLTKLADFDAIGAGDVEAHLTDLAVDGNVAASTQNTAFHGLLAFFKLVLKRDMGRIEAIRANKGKQVPTVMSSDEVARVFDGLDGVHLVIAELLYGCGMRISEAVRLRVKDLDFDNRRVEIHQSKGGKSRVVPMPEELVKPLQRFMATRKALHDHDLAEGKASVWLPHALAKKYPSAPQQFRWQYLFASSRFSKDPRTGRFHRHHLHHDTFPVHLRRAVEAAGITKHVTSHTFRHCFATHLLWQNTDIRRIQILLGHSDVKTTMIYTHIDNRIGPVVVSPLDRLRSDNRTDSRSVSDCCDAESSHPNVDGDGEVREVSAGYEVNRTSLVEAPQAKQRRLKSYGGRLVFEDAAMKRRRVSCLPMRRTALEVDEFANRMLARIFESARPGVLSA